MPVVNSARLRLSSGAKLKATGRRAPPSRLERAVEDVPAYLPNGWITGAGYACPVSIWIGPNSEFRCGRG